MKKLAPNVGKLAGSFQFPGHVIQQPFRHLTVHNFLGKLRAELFLEAPPSEVTGISFSFGLPKSGWSQFEITFVGIGHFVCMISDIPNDFFADLARAVVGRQERFSVAAHMEPDTIAFYVEDSTLFLCKFDDFEAYKSEREIRESMIERAFMTISFSEDYMLTCLKNLAKTWPKGPSADWAHEFPHALLAEA